LVLCRLLHADGTVSKFVQRTCLLDIPRNDTETGCYTFASIYGKSPIRKGNICICYEDLCNARAVSEVPGKVDKIKVTSRKKDIKENKTDAAGSTLQAPDSHNLMIIGILAMATLITLSAAGDK